jgi:hypothetical protein
VFALLLGISETTVEPLNLEAAERDCRLIATEIEAAMYVYFK